MIFYIMRHLFLKIWWVYKPIFLCRNISVINWIFKQTIISIFIFYHKYLDHKNIFFLFRWCFSLVIASSLPISVYEQMTLVFFISLRQWIIDPAGFHFQSINNEFVKAVSDPFACLLHPEKNSIICLCKFDKFTICSSFLMASVWHACWSTHHTKNEVFH